MAAFKLVSIEYQMPGKKSAALVNISNIPNTPKSRKQRKQTDTQILGCVSFETYLLKVYGHKYPYF